MSEVGLTTDWHPFSAVSRLLLLSLSAMLEKHSIFYTIPEVTWYEPLYNRKLNGNHTRMLHIVLNKSWKQHPHRTSVSPPASHLTNHSSKMNKRCWELLEKQGWTHNQHSPMDCCTWTCLYWPISKDLFISALCGQWIQPSRPARSYGW